MNKLCGTPHAGELIAFGLEENGHVHAGDDEAGKSLSLI